MYRGERDGASGRPNRSATESAESKSVNRPHMNRLSPYAPFAFVHLVLSVGYPAEIHPCQPPLRAYTFLNPRLFSLSATRTLVASLAQEQ